MAASVLPAPSGPSGPISASSLFEYYTTDLWTEHGDPRVASLPLMSTFKIPLTIFSLYLFFVLYAGPRYMANRKAYSLKWPIIIYNLLLALSNAYFFVRLFIISDFGAKALEVDFRPTDDTRPDTMYAIAHAYVYFLTKYIDKLDTIFFILRKKQSQVTGLHVYHHSMVPLLGWLYFRTNAFHVSSTTFALLNSPIHTIMYAYYGLAAFGPHMQPYLWWKRYITQIQIFQFVLLFAHGVYFCLYQTGYSPLFSVDVLFQTLLYFTLFSRFYLKSYSGKKPRKEPKKIE